MGRDEKVVDPPSTVSLTSATSVAPVGVAVGEGGVESAEGVEKGCVGNEFTERLTFFVGETGTLRVSNGIVKVDGLVCDV